MKRKNGKTKKQLISEVHKNLKDHFQLSEVSDVVSLFLEEFISELQSNKPVIIRNFARFSLEKTNPRKFYDVSRGRMSTSAGNKIIKAKLSKNLKKVIVKHLDIKKTFLES